MLIDSSYFIGDLNVPNTIADDVSSSLTNLIRLREKEYLIKLMGYELYKAFSTGIAAATPAQRYLDILLGADFTDYAGKLRHWDGLISITTPGASVHVALGLTDDIFFVVGSLLDGTTAYVNNSLAGLNFRVTQRGYGPLELLKSDNSNIATADISNNPAGGFTWINGTKFSINDKYQIELVSTTINVANVSIAAAPVSPIADYVFYWWLFSQHTLTSGIGQVKTQGQNSVRVSEKYKAVAAWNSMVDRSILLYYFLKQNIAVYPEYQLYLNDRGVSNLLTKIHASF